MTKLDILRFIKDKETVWRYMLEEELGLSSTQSWRYMALLKKAKLIAAFHSPRERNNKGQFALGNAAYYQLTDLGYSKLDYLERREYARKKAAGNPQGRG